MVGSAAWAFIRDNEYLELILDAEYSANILNQEYPLMDAPVRTTTQLTSIIKRLRRDLGLTQSRFGEKVGLSQERISAIENHPERVTIDQFLTILMALGAELVIRPRMENKPDAPESW